MVQILLSTYNGEQFLPRQLDSLLEQTYADWRLLIRDDGSSDGTISIIKTYTATHSDRIRLMEDNEHVGAYRSFGRLLQHTEPADYYAFCDQDDIWLPHKLQRCVETMQRTESEEPVQPQMPIVVHCDLTVVDKQLQTIHPSLWEDANIGAEWIDKDLHYLAICNSVTGCAMLFNNAARAASLPMSPDSYMHDAWVALRSKYLGGKLIPISESLVLYRQHSHNAVGAFHYSVWGEGWKKRWDSARKAYHMTHPMIFKNKMHFLLWKIRFWIKRAVKNI